MSRRAGWCALLPVAGIALLTSPACAASPLDIPAAVPPQFRALVRDRLHAPAPQPRSRARFEVSTRQGYDLVVTGAEGIVALEVTRSEKGHASGKSQPSRRQLVATAYVARGTVTAGRVEASFGALGRIDVRFRPSGRRVSSARRHRCRGKDRFTSRLGVFVGSIRFRGEDHYVQIDAHRARGSVRTPLRLRCAFELFRPRGTQRGRPVTSHPLLQTSLLQAESREGVSGEAFLAFQIGRRTLFLAITEESLGTFAEIRYAIAIGRSRAFAHNEALTSATLKPPRPFAGAGIYAAKADGRRSWTGNLTASFPGAPRFPLAGPEFSVGLQVGF